MRGVMIIPDQSGHTEVAWDTELAEPETKRSYGDSGGVISTGQARDLFDELTGNGYLAFATLAVGTTRAGAPIKEQTRQFDPTVGELTFTRPMVAG